MEVDSQVVVCLLALKQLGGLNVPAKQDVFTKGLKAPLQHAVEKGYVRVEKTTVTSTGPGGKPKKAKVDVLSLTDEGEQALRRAAQPDALAATASSQSARLVSELEADRQSLRADVLAALGAGGKGKPDALAKELGGLGKTLADLASKLQKIEAQVAKSGPEAILDRIDEAFATLRSKLDKVAGSTPAAATTSPTAPALDGILHRAYRDLRQLIEFEDGLVPLPRLYHQARSQTPTLSVEKFHDELRRLWHDRTIQLKVLNEVRTAVEPEKAIRDGDNLYYFLMWNER